MTNAATEGIPPRHAAGFQPTQDIADQLPSGVGSPNPFTVEALIRYELPATTGALTMVVTNSLGQVVRSLGGLPASGTQRFEKGALPKGVYQIAFYENGALLARKQVVISE